ncbi:hypothetical protein [Frigidibacter sp. SD6-1]|uniref:hypothetical protein n=1 Tax=Frigidibacter sp. SD6-1 TaxID=3032581 RepID=UPI0024DFB417|nr:hypothetical protein [Frigidibacter sp. SD6-1]
MNALQTWMRRALHAAFLLLPLPVLAEVAARLDQATGAVIVTGLAPQEISAVITDAEVLSLRLENSPSTRGMLVSNSQEGEAMIVQPRFALKAGARYELTVAGETLSIALPAPETTTPRLVSFAPSQAVIPANTLRLYLHFSEPMARGQLREMVSLATADGTLVASPFLSLEAELWDPSQTRATLLLDPGRIKQGVGPNVAGGAPLQEGQTYRLTVSPELRSAAGHPLAAPVSVAFRVGPPERRAIAPETWEILAPEAGSSAPLSLAFDRIMDSGAALRLITLQAPDGQPVRGQITSDGGGWSLIPDHSWQAGSYSLNVDPELEDISGNTIGAPFDAAPGTIGTSVTAASIAIQIRKN